MYSLFTVQQSHFQPTIILVRNRRDIAVRVMKNNEDIKKQHNVIYKFIILIIVFVFSPTNCCRILKLSKHKAKLFYKYIYKCYKTAL